MSNELKRSSAAVNNGTVHKMRIYMRGVRVFSLKEKVFVSSMWLFCSSECIFAKLIFRIHAFSMTTITVLFDSISVFRAHLLVGVVESEIRFQENCFQLEAFRFDPFRINLFIYFFFILKSI